MQRRNLEARTPKFKHGQTIWGQKLVAWKQGGTAIRMASEDLSTDVVTWLHFKLAGPTNGHNKFDTWTPTPQEAIGIRKSKRGCSPPVARPPWQLPGEHPDANMFEIHWGAADRLDVACHLFGLSQYRFMSSMPSTD